MQELFSDGNRQLPFSPSSSNDPNLKVVRLLLSTVKPGTNLEETTGNHREVTFYCYTIVIMWSEYIQMC